VCANQGIPRRLPATAKILDGKASFAQRRAVVQRLRLIPPNKPRLFTMESSEPATSRGTQTRDTNAPRRQISHLWLLPIIAIAIAIVVLGAWYINNRTDRGVAARWMLLEEPLGPSIAVGRMWDGTVASAGCYNTREAVDSGGGEDREFHTSREDGAVAVRALRVLGLEGVGSRADEWELRGWGPRVAIAVDPQPVLRESCSPQRNGLPRYPMISALLGYDSVVLSTSGSGSLRSQITPSDTTVFRKAGIAVTATDTTVTLRRASGLWFGFRAIAFTRMTDSTCTKEVAVGEEFSCQGFPYVVTVSERFPSAHYRVESLNRDAPNPVNRSDTVMVGGYLTLGVTQEALGTFGDWYSVRIAPSTVPERVQLSIRRLRYRLERFEREADRKRWREVVTQ